MLGLTLGGATALAWPTVFAASGAAPVADLRWLNRITWGATPAAWASLQKLGRERFVEAEIAAPATDAPQLAALWAGGALGRPLTQVLADAQADQKQARRQKGDARKAARKDLVKQGEEVLGATRERHLLRAVYSPAQLREQLTWFWLNHFSVYSRKLLLRWTVADYDNATVRPRALGKFTDLVMATLKSPAMVQYLDNEKNMAGQINENFARELMELHTLGVSGGASGSRYTQADVQALAQILTGLTLAKPNQRAERGGWVEGGTAFVPSKHISGPKTLLGQRIEGGGWDEVERAVRLLVSQDACARFLCSKLALHLVGDDAPKALVARMEAEWKRTGGDIAAVMRSLWLAPELAAHLDGKANDLKDPTQFVVSSLRLLAADGTLMKDASPAVKWLGQLGQPLFGRITPDGYPVAEESWTGPGQMLKRLEVAKAMVAQWNDMSGARPRWDAGWYATGVEPLLAANTRQAIAGAPNDNQRLALLLGSPDWMQR
ncbi:MAG: DUF1800 domain-containing protein [Proteobacteria bacterium]|nr:DUF1800 domain-containing protein [Pseudomonadota bacterium]